MKKTLCGKCNNYFSNRAGNYSKHYKSCNGDYVSLEQRGVCKHCNVRFNLTDKPKGWMANHNRWCEKNPKKSKYLKSASTNSTKHMQTLEARTKAAESIKKAWENGKYNHLNHKTFLGKSHSEKSKKLMSESALKSKHRRILRSTRKYICRDGSEVLLDSSWEEELAKQLDKLNINWIRPKNPINWVDKQGKMHNYFPDFYLTDHDIYLDPKNTIVYNSTLDKIEALKTILPNLIILRSLEECKNFKI